MSRMKLFFFTFALAAAFGAGAAIAGSSSTPKSQFPLEMTLGGMKNCLKVGQTVTQNVKLVNATRHDVIAKVPVYGVSGGIHDFAYISSAPALTTQAMPYTGPDGKEYIYYNRFWHVRIKPGATRSLSITVTVPDWDVPDPPYTDPTTGIVTNPPPPQPYPRGLSYDLEIRGKTASQYTGGMSPYCGLTPDYTGGGGK